jgi:hypothetical protein
VFTGKFCVTNYRLQMNFFQTACFSHSISLDDVFEDGNDGFFRQPRIKKDRSPVFGEWFFANQTVQQSGVVRTVCGADADISFATNTVFGAVFILTAKVLQVVHDPSKKSKSLLRQKLVKQQKNTGFQGTCQY